MLLLVSTSHGGNIFRQYFHLIHSEMVNKGGHAPLAVFQCVQHTFFTGFEYIQHRPDFAFGASVGQGVADCAGRVCIGLKQLAAKVKEVRIHEDTGTAEVIVPDYQLSLAIGKEGQNARLAARLTGLRIDIKSENQAAAEARAKAIEDRKKEIEQKAAALKAQNQAAAEARAKAIEDRKKELEERNKKILEEREAAKKAKEVK